MAEGPGKYDALADYVVMATGARKGVLVVVLGGREGDGCSFKCNGLDDLIAMARMLREVASMMECDAPALAIAKLRGAS
jgi:hypothetical protein